MSNHFNQLLFETLPTGLAVCELDGTLKYVNPAFAQILGRTVEETLNLTYWEITPEDFAQQEQDQLISLEKTGRYGPYQKEYFHKQGHRVPVRLSGVLIEENDQKLIWSSVEDITDQKRFETDLLVLNAAFDQSSDAIIITDADLDTPGPFIKYANHAYEILTGYTREELIGSSPRMLQGPKTDLEVIKALSKAIRSGKNFHDETINYRKDGSEYWVEWDIAPVLDADGNVSYFVSVQRDITHRKEIEFALAQSNERQQELSHVLAHDLKSPLSTVHLALQMVLQLHGDDVPKQVRDYVSESITALDNMTTKVSDLVDEAIDASQEEQIVNLDRVLALARKDVLVDANACDAEITLHPMPPVRGKRAELREIFQNLLANAVKYRHPDRLPRINVQVETDHTDPQFVCIGVRDNGLGLAKDQYIRIFETGYRSSPNDLVPGTGLGLAFVKAAVERSGGKVWVESEKGQGSTFKLTLPIAT